VRPVLPTTLLTLALSAACAGEPAETPGPALLPATSYCEHAAEVFCPFYLRCAWTTAEDLDDCRAQFLGACHARWEPVYVLMAEAGLLGLSRAGLETCARHLADVGCAAQASELSGPCAGVWIGGQPEGGACGMGAGGVEALVCAPGTRCILDLSFCGLCRATSARGAACAMDSECAAADACVDDHCTARAGALESCSDRRPCITEARCDDGVCVLRHHKEPPGEGCPSPLDCQYGSICRGGTCTLAAATGASCDGATPCQAGFCAGGRCAAALAPQATCADGDQCQSGACVDDLCTAIPGACFDP
jgi:hypothetical protein